MTLSALPVPTASDLKLIERCDCSVRVRRLLEIALIRKLAETVVASGHVMSVTDGDDRPVSKSNDIEAVINAVFAVDEAWIDIYNDKKKWVGQIFIVLGNSGWDSISDYHTSLEALLKPVNDYADQLSEWR